MGTALRALQWVLVLESWRPRALWAVSPAARLARLMCVFLVDSELFRETPIQRLVAALLARLCQPEVLPNLNLDCPLPGLTSFPDLYANFLEHFEAVSFEKRAERTKESMEIFSKKEYREKLSARQILEIVQEESEGYKEVW